MPRETTDAVKKESAPVDRSIACEACRRIAEGVDSVEVTRSFRTTRPGGIGAVKWAFRLTCKIITPKDMTNTGEWGYPIHAVIVHPEVRNTYALLCAFADKVERKESRAKLRRAS